MSSSGSGDGPASEIQEHLLAEAGGTWSLNEVAQHLEISLEAVEHRLQRGELLTVDIGEEAFPRCQFTDTGTVDGLDVVLRAIDTESSWTQLSVLLSPTLIREPGVDPSNDEDVSVIEALNAGHTVAALHAARSWGRHGAL